jgi:uncharacterized protein (DUF2147 family)
MEEFMKRVLALMVLAIFASGGLFAADNVLGLWKIIDDKTQKPTAVVQLYMYGGQMYGRILVTISKKTGQIDDTIYTKTFPAKGVAGLPPNCGLDFVYKMEDKGKEWKGLIIDPEPGDEYDCVIKKEGDNLKVRGQLKGLGFLGRDQKWLAASPDDLPADFAMPDVASFTPVIPKKM